MEISFIATATYACPPRGYGGEVFFWDLCESFAKMGHKVTLYAAAGSKCPPNGILHYIPEQYNAQGAQYVSADPMRILYRRDILSSDFIIDASHTKTTMEEIAYFHREAKYKTIGILNGMVSHTPMCPRYNIVVGSKKWKELLESGFTQFAGTPWEGQYGGRLFPMPKGAIIDVIPWACSTEFYTPGDKKEDYYAWFCYDDKTEVLTKAGWKSFNDVNYQDYIATLNPQNNHLEYQQAIDIQHFPYDGELVHFAGRSYDSMVTPNHDVFCRSGHSGKKREFQLMKANELLGLVQKRSRKGLPEFKRDAIWIGKPQKEFILPSITIIQQKSGPNKKLPSEAYNLAYSLHNQGVTYRAITEELSNKYGPISVMSIWEALNHQPKPRVNVLPEKHFRIDLWLEFFAWWISEGYSGQSGVGHGAHYNISISQNAGENLERIKQIVSSMGYNYCIGKNDSAGRFGKVPCYQVMISNKQLYLYLHQFGKAKVKRIPFWIKELPPDKLQLFINTLIKGDGHKIGDLLFYHTASKILADDIQEIAIKAGFTATIGLSNTEYTVVMGTHHKTPAICVLPKRVHYQGVVHDVTVPKHHIILVRRNGKPIWSGNSRPTPYKGLGRAINIARNTKIHLKLAMPMDMAEHKYWGEEYLKQIADANANGAQIEFVKLPNNSQHHEAKRELYRRARALLFTIESEEPFGLTVIEALSTGTPVLATRIGCYTDDIQVFTPTGIKSHQECKIGDLVWSISDQGCLEAKPIKTIVEYDYEGEILHFKNGTYDFRVTPNHRMLIREPGRKHSRYEMQYLKAMELRKQGKGLKEIVDIVQVPRGTVDKWIYNGTKPKGVNLSDTKDFAQEYRYLEARGLLGKWHYQLPITCTWTGVTPQLKRFQTEYNSNHLTDDMALGDLFELIGWYIAEGCIGYGTSKKKCKNKTEVRLCEPKTGHYRIELEDLLIRLNIKFNNKKDQHVQFCHAELAKLFSEAGEGAENKVIPAWLLEANPILLHRLFLGIMKGDGWKQRNGRFYGLSTISFALVQSFLELCLKLGRHARWRQMPPRGHYFDGRIINSGISFEVYVNSRKGLIKPKDVIKEYYKGKVWCFEVEDNHNLLIGKNQFAFCGNSMPEIITHGHNGYLIGMGGPAGDPQNIGAWQRAISWIEEGLINSEDCRKDAVARFDRMVAANRYLQLYERIKK